MKVRTNHDQTRYTTTQETPTSASHLLESYSGLGKILAPPAAYGDLGDNWDFLDPKGLIPTSEDWAKTGKAEDEKNVVFSKTYVSIPQYQNYDEISKLAITGGKFMRRIVNAVALLPGKLMSMVGKLTGRKKTPEEEQAAADAKIKSLGNIFGVRS